MKKFIAILAILMLVPFTAFGLEALSDDVLNNTTGQAGVSIATDININVTMDTLAWGDKDGLGAGTTQGWIGLSDLNMTNLRIRLDGAQQTTLELMTIDVATSDAATYGVVYNRTSGGFDAATVANGTERAAGTTFVRIGLGSQLISMDSMTADVKLAGTAAGVHGSASELGDFAMHNMAMRISALSYVDISAHGGSGVTLDLAVKINSITMAACSWGDGDGMGADAIDVNTGIGDAYTGGTVSTLVVGGDTTQGYIGLKDMAITNLVITGQVLIDVATLSNATPGANVAYIYTTIQARHTTMSDTAVLLQFKNLRIGMDTFAADVALSNASNLSGNLADGSLSVMGSIYISNMDVKVDGWVAIGAH